MTITTHELPMVLAEIEAVSVERLSSSFVRVEFGNPDLEHFGVEGKLYDQRIKLIFPNDAGNLPSFDGADESWYATWMDIPTAERGHMRTYTVREVRGSGADTRIVVDFVLHVEDGASGPGSSWASQASVGDRLVLLGPRKGLPFGGIEFDPGTARNLLLAGDETAVPAICSILDDLSPTAKGVVFLEVPECGDVFDVRAPADVKVVWLAREGRPHGERQIAAVREHFGLDSAVDWVDAEAVDPDLWETPNHSSSGEQIGDSSFVGHDLAGLYAWIAGESRMVTTLRRALVKELEVDRRQVAFMGYWRHGVAMRS